MGVQEDLEDQERSLSFINQRGVQEDFINHDVWKVTFILT